MNLIVAKHSNLELKKHVNAIHCTNNLTLVQRKLFNALLFNAYPHLPYQNCFQIQTRELCRLIGYNSNDYASIKQALLGLITIAIEWNVIDCATGKESKWKASSILSSAELAGGICVYEYSQIMKELLFQPEIYGRVNIELMAKFKSSYGLALYENCIRYQSLPQTPWFTLEIFRKLMGVLGNKYSAFKDFKKRVLNMAIDEVNAISPITIFPEIERKNKQVLRIRFKLSKNPIKDFEDEVQTSNHQELNLLLSEIFGLSAKSIQSLLVQYEVEYIRGKVELIMLSPSFIAGKIRGLAGYLLEALKQDFKPSQSSKRVVEDKRKKRKQEIKNIQEEKNQADKMKARYHQYLNNKINQYLTKLTKEQYDGLMNDFSLQIQYENTVMQGWYKKQRLEHPGVKSFFNHFILNKKPVGLEDILSFDSFVSIIEDCG